MTTPNNHINKSQQLIVGLLLSIFFLAGCASGGTTQEGKTQENQKTKVAQEIKLVNDEFSKMRPIYERLMKEYGNKIGNKVLAIALYYDKDTGKQCMVAAISGTEPEVKVPEEEIKNLTPLTVRFNHNEDQYLYLGNYEYPIGTLTPDGFITLDTDGDGKNFRNTEAEMHLIKHMLHKADLDKNIYLFSSQPICPSCGGIKYSKNLPQFLSAKSLNLARVDSQSTGKREKAATLLDEEIKTMPYLLNNYKLPNSGFTITPTFVYAGALGQFAGCMTGGTLYAAEVDFKTGDLYKWYFHPQAKEPVRYRYVEGKQKWEPLVKF